MIKYKQNLIFFYYYEQVNGEITYLQLTKLEIKPKKNKTRRKGIKLVILWFLFLQNYVQLSTFTFFFINLKGNSVMFFFLNVCVNVC